MWVGKENGDNRNIREVGKYGCHVKSQSKVNIWGEKNQNQDKSPFLEVSPSQPNEDVEIPRGSKMCILLCLMLL